MRVFVCVEVDGKTREGGGAFIVQNEEVRKLVGNYQNLVTKL